AARRLIGSRRDSPRRERTWFSQHFDAAESCERKDVERFLLRSALGRVSKARHSGGLSRSRPGFSAATGLIGIHSKLYHVQHLVVSNGEYVRVCRYDLWRCHGTVPQTESRLSGRELRLDPVAPLAHGRIRRTHWHRGTPGNEARAVGIFSTAVLGRRRM